MVAFDINRDKCVFSFEIEQQIGLKAKKNYGNIFGSKMVVVMGENGPGTGLWSCQNLL